MANYSKSFNFRNGVQVDEDNLVVDTLGKVGIGTSVPNEVLDVRGNATITGFTTTTDLYSKNIKISGIITASTFTDGKLTINSGIITASSGVVTFYGDGAGLINLPTSQWVDIDVGLGFTSIYSRGFVGVNTTDPRFAFQVAGNNNVSGFSRGVGINSAGDIVATGIITASTVRASIAATFLTGTIDNARLASNINVSGIVTAAGGFVGSLTGTASTAQSLTGTPNIIVGVTTATNVFATDVNLTSNAVVGGFVSVGTTLTTGASISVTGNASVTGILTAADIKSGVSTVGIATVFEKFHVGTSGTIFAVSTSGNIGIGSELPTSDFLLRRPDSTILEVVSDTSEARISIGQSVGVGNSSAVLRFGNALSAFDILNRSTGSFNNYIHAGSPGIGTQNFNWIYGQSNAELMTLTYGGRLGLGKTNPDTTLHVVGTSTVTGNSWFGGNVTITGTLSAGTISLPSIISGTNIVSNAGFSTFYDVTITNNLGVINKVGVGTTNPQFSIDARGKTVMFGGVGINTNSTLGNVALNVEGTCLFTTVGIGTTIPVETITVVDRNSGYYASDIKLYTGGLYGDSNSKIGIGTTASNIAVDFSNAGQGPLAGNGIGAYMVVPKITSTQRTGLSTQTGAIIFNTTSREFQGFVPPNVVGVNSSWINLGVQTSIIDSNQINVSGVSTFNSTLKVGTGVTIQSGIVTATNGFLSGIGTAVQITTVGNQLIFTVPGVGTTSFTLF